MAYSAHPPTLLVCLARTIGHFTIYTSNLLDWALRRGCKALCMAPVPESTNLYRKFKDVEEVRFLDLAQVLPHELRPCLAAGDREILRTLFSVQGVQHQINAINHIQAEVGADWSVLINSDDMLFNSNLFLESDSLFTRPTYGVSTFGFRDYYLGFEDVYTYRLNRIAASRKHFAGMFTLDEYHVAQTDAAQEFLLYLPDPYKEFARLPEEQISDSEKRQLDTLRQFLDADSGPLIPLLGKFDERKNGLWILELAARTPDLSLVLLGERLPSPYDERIDSLLHDLQDAGRAFVHTGFTTEHGFEAALHCPRVPFVPFAYKTHYGSSGVHLHALEAGRPCLVADVGLMALRTLANDLGSLFVHDERADFEAAFARCLATASPIPESAGRFMRDFTPERLDTALDYAFGFSNTPPALPDLFDPDAHRQCLDYFPPFQQGLAELHARAGDCGASAFDAALALRPGHATIQFRSAMAAHAAGRDADCRSIIDTMRLRQPSVAEIAFAFPLFLSLARHFCDTNSLDEAAQCNALCRLLRPEAPDPILIDTLLQHKSGRHDAVLEFQQDSSDATGDRGLVKTLWSLKISHLADACPVGKATEAAEQALAIFAADNDILFLIGLHRQYLSILLDAGQTERALQAADRALEAFPTDSEILHFKAIGLQRRGRQAEALPLLETVLADSFAPAEQRRHYLRTKGGTHAALRQYEQAQACFREALSIDPEFHEVRLNLSDVLRYAKNYNAAAEALNALEAMAPEHESLHLKRGQILFEQGLFAEALAAFEREYARGTPSEFLLGYLLRTRERLAAHSSDGVKVEGEKAKAPVNY